MPACPQFATLPVTFLTTLFAQSHPREEVAKAAEVADTGWWCRAEGGAGLPGPAAPARSPGLISEHRRGFLGASSFLPLPLLAGGLGSGVGRRDGAERHLKAVHRSGLGFLFIYWMVLSFFPQYLNHL